MYHSSAWACLGLGRLKVGRMMWDSCPFSSLCPPPSPSPLQGRSKEEETGIKDTILLDRLKCNLSMVPLVHVRCPKLMDSTSPMALFWIPWNPSTEAIWLLFHCGGRPLLARCYRTPQLPQPAPITTIFTLLLWITQRQFLTLDFSRCETGTNAWICLPPVPILGDTYQVFWSSLTWFKIKEKYHHSLSLSLSMQKMQLSNNPKPKFSSSQWRFIHNIELFKNVCIAEYMIFQNLEYNAQEFLKSM